MLRKLAGSLEQGSEAMKDRVDALNRKVSRAREIQKATYPLMDLVANEKLIIESALESARLRVKHEEQMKNPLYREAHELFREYQESMVSKRHVDLPEMPLPCFELIAEHPDPETEQAIRNRIEEIRDEHARGLRSVVAELGASNALAEPFLAALEERGGIKYLVSLKNAGWTGLGS